MTQATQIVSSLGLYEALIYKFYFTSWVKGTNKRCGYKFYRLDDVRNLWLSVIGLVFLLKWFVVALVEIVFGVPAVSRGYRD